MRVPRFLKFWNVKFWICEFWENLYFLKFQKCAWAFWVCILEGWNCWTLNVCISEINTVTLWKRWVPANYEDPSNYVLGNLEYGINVFQPIWNDFLVTLESWNFEIWNEEKKRRNLETEKRKNQDTQKQRNQETKKRKNEETKKQRNQHICIFNERDCDF